MRVRSTSGDTQLMMPRQFLDSLWPLPSRYLNLKHLGRIWMFMRRNSITGACYFCYDLVHTWLIAAHSVRYMHSPPPHCRLSWRFPARVVANLSHEKLLLYFSQEIKTRDVYFCLRTRQNKKWIEFIVFLHVRTSPGHPIEMEIPKV